MSLYVKVVHFVRRISLFLHKRYLGRALGACGSNLSVHGKTWVIYPNRIQLGDGVHLNHGCVLYALGSITVGSRCHLSSYVQLQTGGLQSALGKRASHKSAPIVLEDDVWVGANVVILPGVVIGKGSILAAGAVVSRNIPSGEIWGGVPARFIKKVE